MTALLPQLLSRFLIAFIAIPYTTGPFPFIYSTLICFSLADSTRYFYYFLKMNEDKSILAKIFGNLRYNLFLIAYPIGALGEAIILWNSKEYIRSAEPKHFSIAMPNKYNFAFDMEYFINITPLLYLTGFPNNYIYMLNQRN
jgi:hypothetical protein